VSLDEALAGAAAEFGSKMQGQGKTEIAIAGIDAPSSEAAGFLIDELSTHLASNGAFTVLERGAALDKVAQEHKFQMDGMVSDSSAVGIGHYLGAKAVVTGVFKRYPEFSQLRLRVIDVRSSQLLTMYNARIRPDDAVQANVMKPLDDNSAGKTLSSLDKAKYLLKEKKYGEAVTELGLALSADKNSAECYFYRGEAYAGNEKYLNAVTDYTAALKIKPDYHEALYKRGWANYYLYDENYDRGIADFTAALKIKPDYREALYARGKMYAYKGDQDRAVADFTAALKIKPNDHEALFYRGFTHAAKSRYDLAIADYTAALKILPDYADALQHRGDAYACRCIEKNTALLDSARRNGGKTYALPNFRKNSACKGDIGLAEADWKSAGIAEPESYAIFQRSHGLVECFTIASGERKITVSADISGDNCGDGKGNRGGSNSGSFTDTRNSQKYRTIKIGSQTWMAENLNFKADSSLCYDNNDANCKKYGRLYNWGAAKASCPKGWHLPDRDEWNALISASGGARMPLETSNRVYAYANAGITLKADSDWHYKGKGVNCIDSLGFSALPGGSGYFGSAYPPDNKFDRVGQYGYWWSATESGGSAFWRGIFYDNDKVTEGQSSMSNAWLSVRCVKD
jgi:uncharacterized protein (TIGR02145 family)